jgi:type I restriction enzyme, S subunit
VKAGWSRPKVSDFAKTSAGGTPAKSKNEFYVGGTIPWLLSGEVGSRNITSAKNRITEAGLSGSSAKLFPPNSVLVAMYGATAGEVGILRFEAATNQAVCAVLPNDAYLPEYLYYYLLSAKPALVSQAVGNAQPNISQAKVKDLRVPLPPLGEQRRIVALLDKVFQGLDRARQHTETNLASAKELVAARREEVFSSDRSGWSSRPLAELIEIKHGFAFKSEFFASSGEFVLLTPGNYYESGGYRDRGVKQRYYCGEIPDGFVLEPGDLLMAMTEQAPGLLGSCIIVPEEGTFLHNQRLGLVSPKNGIDFFAPFFAEVFNTVRFRRALADTCSGIKVRHTSPTKILATCIPFPESRSAQVRAAGELQELESFCRKVQQNYEAVAANLVDLRRSILQHAFAGELT